MRPTRLELEGFISFRESTKIDFSALDLFGITGPTGAGKTALIDSIIFALYGKTPRLGEKAVQELISQGAPQLRVLLEFQSGEDHYRVLRIVKRKGAGRTQIERQLDGDWVPVAGSTKELLKRVEEIVGLDFDGFTRTVVLPQGQFDRFLRGDGAARRRILSDLLGLGVYEQMMRRANEIARDASRQADVLTEVAAQNFGAATPERMLAIEVATGETLRMRNEAASEVASLERALPLVMALRAANAESARYSAERDRLRKGLAEAAKQVGPARRRTDELRRQMQTAAYDPARHLEVTSMLPVARRHVALLRAIESLRERASQEAGVESGLSKEAADARTAWEQAQRRVAETSLIAQRAAKSWQEFRSRHGSPESLGEAARGAGAFRRTQVSLVAVRKQIVETREAVKEAGRNANVLAEQERKAATRVVAATRGVDHIRLMHSAAGVRQLLQAGEPCPVCLHPVGELPLRGEAHAGVEAANAELRAAESERELVRKKVSANRMEMEALPKKIEADLDRAQQWEEAVETIRATVQRLSGAPLDDTSDPAELLKDLALRGKVLEDEALKAERGSREAGANETSARQKLQEIETKAALAEQSRESAARELAAKLDEFGATQGEFDLPSLEAEVASLTQARELNEKLGREMSLAERAISRAEVDERSLSEQLALAGAALAGLQERADDLQSQLEGLPFDAQIELRLAEARLLLQQASAKLSTAQMERKMLLDQAREAEELDRRVRQLAKEGSVYSKLGSMLRTDQFTAWILKDAFARLAYEGSRQLETLSNGRYTFAAGGDDFAVCDRWNAGERRSVHTLSGGESFLASLSLALALSRGLPDLAANREKFHLDSLFLDEGFSTLDAETLDTVLGAVEMLQADCRLIGVISHAAELADRLPGRIEVVKGANGSRVVVR